MTGREKCEELKKLRVLIAQANGIDFVPFTCDSIEDCTGTCPKCEEEIELLSRLLQEKRADSQPSITPSSSDVFLKEVDSKEALFDMPIEEMNLSVRSYNCLKRANIHTVRDIINKAEYELVKICNPGRKSSQEVIDKIHSYGLELGTPTPNELQNDWDYIKANKSDRVCFAKLINISISRIEYTSFTDKTEGCVIYFNMLHNGNEPLQLEVLECSLWADGMQRHSTSNLTGFVFSDSYFLPGTERTFAKIWNTEKWEDKRVHNDGYVVLAIKTKTSSKKYYYKFNYYLPDKWTLDDYWQFDI